MNILLVLAVVSGFSYLMLYLIGWTSPQTLSGWGGATGIDHDPDLDKLQLERQLKEVIKDINAEYQGKRYKIQKSGKSTCAILSWEERHARSYWKQPNRVKRDVANLSLLFSVILLWLFTFAWYFNGNI